MMMSPLEPREDSIQTISGKDRYSISAQLFARSFTFASNSSAVIASGEDASSCLLANTLAGSLESALLLVKHGSIPDEARSALEERSVKDSSS